MIGKGHPCSENQTQRQSRRQKRVREHKQVEAGLATGFVLILAQVVVLWAHVCPVRALVRNEGMEASVRRHGSAPWESDANGSWQLHSEAFCPSLRLVSSEALCRIGTCRSLASGQCRFQASARAVTNCPMTTSDDTHRRLSIATVTTGRATIACTS